MTMPTNVQEFPVRFTEDDLGPPITGQVGTGSTDITGYTFTLTIDRPGTTVLSKSGSVVDEPTGTFTFGNWIVGDLVKGEKQLCKVKVVDAAAVLVSSDEFVIHVDGKIA